MRTIIDDRRGWLPVVAAACIAAALLFAEAIGAGPPSDKSKPVAAPPVVMQDLDHRGAPLSRDAQIEQIRREVNISPLRGTLFADPPAKVADPPLVELLRRAAHALDEKAASLEPQRRYQRADEMRRLADQIRREARRLDNGPPEKERSADPVRGVVDPIWGVDDVPSGKSGSADR